MSSPETEGRSAAAGSAEWPRIRGYRIEGVLGEGAVGTVYRARHLATGTRVALKVLHATGPRRRKQIARLVKEGRMMARLNHPGIVKGLDVGESGGRFYIAMELVEGASLRDHLERGRVFTEEEALEIAVRVVKALDHAARAGVVHRDIKPANLILTPDGRVKITDLGLAKDALDLSLTKSDATIGTPHYISPEQARNAQAVDLRSDIFSLGATLYHMVTGRLPFPGETVAEVITRVLYEPEEPPERWNPSLSRPFAKLLRRMLAKDPEERYQDYRQLLEDLERVRAGLDIRGPRRLSASAPRRLRALLFAGAFLGAAAGLYALVSSPRARPRPPPSPAVRPAAGRSVPPAPRAAHPWRRELRRARAGLFARLQKAAPTALLRELEALEERFSRYGPEAARAAAALRADLEEEAAARLLQSWSGRVEVLRAAVAAALKEPTPKSLPELQQEFHRLERELRALPPRLARRVLPDLQRMLAEVRLDLRTRVEAWVRAGLARARRHLAAVRLVSARSELERVQLIRPELFFPESRVLVQELLEALDRRRAAARSELQGRWRTVREGVARLLAAWRYREGAQALANFRAELAPWVKEAPGAAVGVSRALAEAESDFRGLLALWQQALQALRSLARERAVLPLEFGGERSRKGLLEVSEGEYPEEVTVRFRVGRQEFVRPVTALDPAEVIHLARRTAPVEPRREGLFYLHASRRPGCPLSEARRLLLAAEEAFGRAGGAGRYADLLTAWRRELAQTAREREEKARALKDEAEALARAWRFREALDRWAHMHDHYREAYTRLEGGKAVERLRRLLPLEVLRRRFPGARREHLPETHPLGFRLTFRFDAEADLTGLDCAWELWRPRPEGLVRVPAAGPAEGFPRRWGLRVAVPLEFGREPVRARVVVRTDPAAVVSLFGFAVGGNVLGLLNLTGVPPERRGTVPFPYLHQMNLWVSPVRRLKRGEDVFQGYAAHFLWRSGQRVPAGLRTDWRLRLGGTHTLELVVDARRRRVVFLADGQERHRYEGRVGTLPEVEVRTWNAPLVLKELSIQGVLKP